MTHWTGLAPHPAVGTAPSRTAALPALLFPVRLETRFTRLADGPYLLVRIYPDQIAVDTHEPNLTSEERESGIAYWDALWRVGTGAGADDRAPWRALATRFGPQRAAWIAARLTPENLSARPTAPTPAGANPIPVPSYPAAGAPRASSWERAPLAACLPERWSVALDGAGATRRVSAAHPVRRPLAVGPEPGASGPADGSELQVDAGMRWMVEFDEAEAAGMGVRIKLSDAEAQAGFDRVIVVGLSDEGVQGAARMRDLLDAHHYTDGLAFVRQGTPTNNTPGAPSGYSDRDPGFDRSFGIERLAPLALSDGAVAARAFGIPDATFNHVEGADATDRRNARAMAVAAWPATLGYFLTQIMGGALSPEQVARAREYFQDHVCTRGPISTFRVGDTPYGILPATSLALYAAPGDELREGLCRFLREMLGPWQTAAAAVAPRVGGAADPDAALVRVLAMDASAQSYRTRHVLGEEWLRSLVRFLGAGDEREITDAQTRVGRRVLERHGFGQWDPRVVHLALARGSREVPFEIVQDEPLSETAPLTPFTRPDGTKGNYISWIRNATIEELRDDAQHYPTGAPPTALLYRVLRQSILLTYSELAGRAAVDAGVLRPEDVREEEMVDVRGERRPSITPWRVLAMVVPGVGRPGQPIGEYLEKSAGAGGAFGELGELRESLDWLAALPSAELERLFTETLDTCSHRLDAWVTSLATDRLTSLRGREGAALGVHVGGFGLVEDLRPRPPEPVVAGPERARVDALDAIRTERAARTGAARRAAPAAPRDVGGDSGGFIHAPSLAQARAAAVLRAGYLSHRASSNADTLAVDLSSDRARSALWLLDGVRQGQQLGALLGYRFEFGLHRAGLAEYIPAFRNAYPLVANRLTPPGAAQEPADRVAAPNVADGLKLQRVWRADMPGWADPLPTRDDHRAAVTQLMADLDDVVDALGDLSIAESVFQILRGNYVRAGGLLDALSRGEHAPDPEILRTPRAGLDVTHRVALLMTGTPSRDPAWPGAGHPRAMAEPRLDAWLAAVLPRPSAVRCEVRDADAAPGTAAVTVTLADLDLGPLDVLTLADAATEPQDSELEQRIRYAALGALPAGVERVDITFARGTGAEWGSGILSFPELLALLRSTRDFLGGSRPLSPQDLVEPETRADARGASIDIAELESRAGAARAALDAARSDLAAATTATAGALRSSLLSASLFGVAGAVPRSRGADAAALEALRGQAAVVLPQMQQRLAAAGAVMNAPPAAGAGAEQRRDHLLALLQTVFGRSFVALPRFTPADVTPPAKALTVVLSRTATLLGGDGDALARWVQRLTHVRAGVSRFDAFRTMRSLLGRAAPAGLAVGQLPDVGATDRWVALAPPPGEPLPATGRVAIVAEVHGAYDGGEPHAGLMIDEWTERIPGAEQTTGLAFHYDQPSAAAPQLLLLAVPPDARASWDEELLERIVRETADLARIRTVDYESLIGGRNLPPNTALDPSAGTVGQILPALYFAFNLDRHTVSTSFTAPATVADMG